MTAVCVAHAQYSLWQPQHDASQLAAPLLLPAASRIVSAGRPAAERGWFRGEVAGDVYDSDRDV